MKANVQHPRNGQSPTATGGGLRWRAALQRLWPLGHVRNPVLHLLQRNMVFSIYLTAIGLFYIWNAHYAEKQVRVVDGLEEEIRELKSEYMTLNAQLSKSRKQSEIVPAVDSLLGLKPLSNPPFVLYRHSKKN